METQKPKRVSPIELREYDITFETLDLAISHHKWLVKHTAANLRNSIQSLVLDLSHSANTLEADPNNATINSLGIIQGRGSFIDILCAELNEFRRVLRMLLKLKAQEK